MNQVAGGMVVGLILGYAIFYVIYAGFLLKSTTMTIQYPDGSWIKGIRKKNYINNETHGTHHYFVTEVSEFIDKGIIGKRIAVPINSVKYFIIEEK
jgi:hypothetical protein